MKDWPLLGVLNDIEIEGLSLKEPLMIDPFCRIQQGKPSWGLGSFGYDIRLGHQFLVPMDETGPGLFVLSPLIDTREAWEKVRLNDGCVINPGETILGESMETFHMPEDVLGLVEGKSSYARMGILVNGCPLEPGWIGKLTLSIANVGTRAVDLITRQGIAQVVFFRGKRPGRAYSEKETGGVWQHQVGVAV